MANFDNHFILLTEELADIFDDEVRLLRKGQESIFFLRQAGHDIYGARRYRTRAMQAHESLLHRMETILDKTGILRDECILTVIDAFIELYSEGDKMKWMKAKENPTYMAEHLEAVLDPYRT